MYRVNMKKFLITGITGFAGPHLANLLVEKGHHVSGLIRRTNGMEADILDIVTQEVFDSIEFHKADLTNYQSLNKIFSEHSYDGIFHTLDYYLQRELYLFHQ